MTYDNEVKLITRTLTEDSLAQQIESAPVYTTVLCSEKAIKYSEFYKGAQSGIRPEITLIIHRFEYSGQKEVEYLGQTLKVIRTYPISSEEIELICGDIVGS